MRLRILAACAASLCAAARADLRVSDSLNQFQIYGKSWVCIYGDGITADSGAIGSDHNVEMLNNNMKVGGDLISGDTVKFLENIKVAGRVNARGNVYMTSFSSVAGKMNVGGRVIIYGANPMGNVFQDSMYVANAPIQVAAPWAANTYAGAALNGSVGPGTPGKPGKVRFGVTQPFPTTNMILPDTTVDPDPTRNCATMPEAVFNMSMCGLGGAPGDSILPPGRYGDFTIASGNRFYLGSGTYQFRSLTLKSDGTKMIFVQGKKGTTRVLIDREFTVEAGKMLIAPDQYAVPGFKGGTVMIYANGKITLGDDGEFWATLISPHFSMSLESGIHLFGQVFAAAIRIENGFDGSAGKGRYIPLQNKRTLKYSVIHFKHPY